MMAAQKKLDARQPNICLVRQGSQGKKALVLLHGWGMNAAVWSTLVPYLEQEFDLYSIDLPGHGGSDMPEDLSDDVFNVWLEAIEAVLPQEFDLLAWSLGGLFAVALADRLGDRVQQVILIASNPHFTEAANWPGVKSALLDGFSQRLRQNIPATIKQFLALQFYGSTSSEARRGARVLQASILNRGSAQEPALIQGLDFLKGQDVRGSFSRLHGPKVLLGGKDRLVPATLAPSLRALNSSAEVEVFEHASHAPFVSHPRQTAEQLLKWLDTASERLSKEGTGE